MNNENQKTTDQVISNTLENPNSDPHINSNINPDIQNPIPQNPIDVITVTNTQNKPQPLGPKVKLIITSIIILVFLSAGGVFTYIQMNPKKIVERSFIKLSQAASFTSNIQISSTKGASVKMDFVYHKDREKLSSAQLYLGSINNEPNNNLKATLNFNRGSAYTTFNYSRMDIVDKTLEEIYPDYKSLGSYNLLYPVIIGEKWIHLKAVTPTTSPSNEKVVTTSQKETLILKIKNAIVVKSFNINYKDDLGIDCYKISFGFDKTKLVELIEEIKNLNLKISLNDINTVKNIINSSDDWNTELVTVLIRKDNGYPQKISFDMPVLSTKAIEDSINKSLEKKVYFIDSDKIVKEILSSYFQNNNGQNIHVGEIVFSDFNSAQPVFVPSVIIEMDDVEKTLQADLPTILQAFLFRQKDPNSGGGETTNQ